MIDAVITWLIGLPPVAVYAVLVVLAAVENVFPPFPSDTVVAIGAYLAYRGVVDPWVVFVVTLVANVAGAMGMYRLGLRHREALFASRIARRILPTDGVVFVRREYDRFGVPGLFVGRLLPGFRAVVPPFAGLIHLGPVRAGVPILLAAGIWYGGIIYGVTRLGGQFDRALAMLGELNRGLAVAALVVVVLIAAMILRRRRHGGPR